MTSSTYCCLSDLGWLSFWLRAPNLSLHDMIVFLACGSLEIKSRIISVPKFFNFFASAQCHRMRSRSNGPFDTVWSKIYTFQECVLIYKGLEGHFETRKLKNITDLANNWHKYSLTYPELNFIWHHGDFLWLESATADWNLIK